MKLKRYGGLSLLAAMAVFTTGCWLFVGAAGAGAGAVWYYGALRSTEDIGHREIYEAGRQSLHQLDIPVHTESVDATAGTIEGETADGKKVVISVKRLTETTSELTLRVGLADESRARMIYDRIRENIPGAGESETE